MNDEQRYIESALDLAMPLSDLGMHAAFSGQGRLTIARALPTTRIPLPVDS